MKLLSFLKENLPLCVLKYRDENGGGVLQFQIKREGDDGPIYRSLPHQQNSTISCIVANMERMCRILVKIRDPPLQC